MTDKLAKSEIIAHPQYYFQAQEKTLDARLEDVRLPEGEVDRVIVDHTKKVVRDKVLGLFKIGEVVNTILNWNDEVDADLREAKKEYLLAQYFARAEADSQAIGALKNFLTSAQGNTLFNKMLRILDDSPPDEELMRHLSVALRRIVDSEFSRLFEAHKYALSQIERLTPQALTILADERSWPLVGLGAHFASGSKVTSDWLVEFVGAYTRSKGISDQAMIGRVQHSVNELIAGRFIEAHLVKEKTARCQTTEIGRTLLTYIDVR